MALGLLPGVRVLDVGERISAPYCARILANLGADVVKVETPDGDESRRMGPFPGDEPHPEKSGLFLALNLNKRGVTLDLEARPDADRFLDLARTADIIVENQPAGWLDARGLGYDALRQANPEVIVASITPFGDIGLYASFKASDLTLYHMSGQAHGVLGPVDDPDSEPPIRAGGHQAEFLTGMAAATASLMALYRKRATGVGCRLVVSSFEAMVTQIISGLANCAYGQPAPSREKDRNAEPAVGGMVRAVGGLLPCTDGYVAISPREEAQWQRWLEVMGNPEWGTDERFATREARHSNYDELWRLVGQWTGGHSKHDVARMGQERRVACFPVNTVEDLLGNDHLREREFFVQVDHPEAGTLRYPGVAYRLTGTPLPLDSRPTPLLGQHNHEMFRE